MALPLRRKGARPGKASAELAPSEEAPLASAARARLDIVSERARHGYCETELYELVVPKRTLARRRGGQ